MWPRLNHYIQPPPPHGGKFLGSMAEGAVKGKTVHVRITVLYNASDSVFTVNQYCRARAGRYPLTFASSHVYQSADKEKKWRFYSSAACFFNYFGLFFLTETRWKDRFYMIRNSI